MPRQARLDAPDTLHHVMVRGLERRVIFRDDADRARLRRPPGRARGGRGASPSTPGRSSRTTPTSWSGRGPAPCPRSMRSLLTGYAGAFNRRHHRVGHLFQNRYKSIVVEEEPYLLELVRYLHLNPLRAKVVPDLRAPRPVSLDAATAPSWGPSPAPGRTPGRILAQFGPTRPPGPAGLPGLRRRRASRRAAAPSSRAGASSGAWGAGRAVAALRRGREAYLGDERILGDSAFVEQIRRAVEATARRAPAPPARHARRPRLSPRRRSRRPTRGGQPPPRRHPGPRRDRLPLDEILGHPGRPLAPILGVRPQAVYQAAARGRQPGEWEHLLQT